MSKFVAGPHEHQWLQSREEAAFRCGVWRCGAKLPMEFLRGLNPDDIGGLNGAYAMYVKGGSGDTREEHVAADATDGKTYFQCPDCGETAEAAYHDCVPPRSKSQQKRIAIQKGTSEGVLEREAGRDNPDDVEGTKVCTVCHKEQPRSEYHKRARSADGLQSRCKSCNVAAVKASRARKKERDEAFGN